MPHSLIGLANDGTLIKTSTYGIWVSYQLKATTTTGFKAIRIAEHTATA
ncbi:unnamed protein product [Enterobius vermicularis]|uniref:Phage tail protein n=1 Tax=Enterobius vermicularis TaxID=51028 RepID=A0A0N4VQ56_ENTVE|nr:unnamed protein product [Enterobius vermicularis]